MPTGSRSLATQLRTAQLLGDCDILVALIHPRVHWHRPGATTGIRGSRDEAARCLLAAPTTGVTVEETFAFPAAVVLALRPSQDCADDVVVYRVYHHNLALVTAIHDYSGRANALKAAEQGSSYACYGALRAGG